ncbi:MAG: alpha/beta hydrolase fold domain-containing protein [bacterium]|nr:alpha/beta hydrolase fold domain-containing protein [bacterium]
MPPLRQSMGHAFRKAFSSRLPQAFLCLIFILFFSISLLLAAFSSSAIPATCGPPQPSSGLGGADYRHSKVISNTYGSGALKYHLFEPDSPKPAMAPVIIFLHGWEAMNPKSYGAWIEHIVRRGNIVVFPAYQSLFTKPESFTQNAARAIKNSLETLKAKNHVKPDLSKFAIVGHSCGGMITANLGALAARLGLPTPRAIMPVEPGWISTVPLENLSMIPSDTLLLTVVGDQDFIAGDRAAKEIFYRSSQIPLEKKDFVIMLSDYHGHPPLKADHFAPGCSSADRGPRSNMGPDALDYYCLWKLFDALTDAAFYGRSWEYALGNTPQQRYMGTWSDGVPVKELIVTDKP